MNLASQVRDIGKGFTTNSLANCGYRRPGRDSSENLYKGSNQNLNQDLQKRVSPSLSYWGSDPQRIKSSNSLLSKLFE